VMLDLRVQPIPSLYEKATYATWRMIPTLDRQVEDCEATPPILPACFH